MDVNKLMAVIITALKTLVVLGWEDEVTGHEIDFLPNPKRYMTVKLRFIKYPKGIPHLDIDCGDKGVHP